MRRVLFIQGETALDLQFNLERIWPHCLIIHAGQLGGRGIHQNARQMLDWLKRSSTKYFTNITIFKESYRLRFIFFFHFLASMSFYVPSKTSRILWGLRFFAVTEEDSGFWKALSQENTTCQKKIIGTEKKEKGNFMTVKV